MDREQRARQDKVCDRCTQQHHAVQRGGHGGKLIFSQPPGNKRSQRQPEKQMEIRPQHASVNMFDDLQQVVMIAPVDTDEDKAKRVAEKYGATGISACQVASCGTLNSSTM